MSKINKILLIVFSVLIIFAVVEVGYFFFFKPTQTLNKNTGSNNSNKTSKINYIDPSIGRNKELAKIYNAIKVDTKTASKSAMNLNTLSSLRSFSKDLVVSSKVSITMKGAIKEINTTGGEMAKTKTSQAQKYIAKLVLSKNKGSHTLYFLHKEDLTKIIVFKNENKKEVPIKLSDLKAGDKILLNLQLDPTKDTINNLIQVKIVKE